MPVDRLQLQSALLRTLANPQADKRLGRGYHYLMQAVLDQDGFPEAPTPQELLESVWSLIAQGLAYLDVTQDAPTNWAVRLTAAGANLIEDREADPDLAEGFLHRIAEACPNLTDLVVHYLREAVLAYTKQLYTASAVMLGVAAEAEVLDVANAFLDWLPATQAEKLEKALGSKKTSYVQKFKEVRKRISAWVNELPDDVTDDLTIQLDAVLNLLRIYRNDAGHPTGKSFARPTMRLCLLVFATSLERSEQLRHFFAANRAPTT